MCATPNISTVESDVEVLCGSPRWCHVMLPTFTNAPLANLSSLFPLDSCLFVFPCHLSLVTPTTTLVAAYTVASPTKRPSGIT